MATPSIEECREFLSNPCEQPDGKTKSVVDHLSMLLLKILETRPENALNLFEEMSAQVKTMPKGGAVEAPAYPCTNAPWANGLKVLRGPPKEPEEGEEGEAEAPEREIDGETLKMTNLVQEAAMFDAAGVGAGLTRLNAVALFTGMRKLANKEPVKSVRLFGKILGMKRDYLICECEYSDDFEEPPPEEVEPVEGEEAPPPKLAMEPSKTGINQFTYYVAAFDTVTQTHDLSSWIKLPHVQPECLMAARKIKKLFTGDLDAPVLSYPPFPGNEADYLRCQIARIACGTSLCLKGMFVIDPEAEEGGPTWKTNEPDEEGNGGFTAPTASQLVNPEFWTHSPIYPSILSGMGRCVEPEGEPLEDEEAEKKRLAAIEKGEPPLKDCAQDRKLRGGLPAWSAKRCSPSLRDHSVSMIKSNRWPGAITVAHGPKFANIYVGNGHKYAPGGFQPFAPPVLVEECSEELVKEQTDESVPLPPPPEEEEAE